MTWVWIETMAEEMDQSGQFFLELGEAMKRVFFFFYYDLQ